jgi:acetyl esterase/lipase
MLLNQIGHKMRQISSDNNDANLFSKSRTLVKLGLVTISTFCLVNLCSAQANVAASTPRYNPNAKFDLKITEVPYRTNASGRVLKARIYEPIGNGPFPTMLDFHGGAWNNKDRLAEQPMDQAIAKSGVLVVAVDLTLAGDAPYPANVQDASYAIRWVKHHAAQRHGDTQ